MSIDPGLIIIAAVGVLEGACTLNWQGMACCFRPARKSLPTPPVRG